MNTDPNLTTGPDAKPAEPIRQDWWFTFGFDHQLPDGTPLGSRYVLMTGMTCDDARAVMFAHFGNRWSHQYRSAEGAGVERFHLTGLPPEQWPAHAATDPERRCRHCGATSGLKMLHSNPLVVAAREWECWDGCRDSAR